MPPEQFRVHGITDEIAEQTKSEIYADLLVLLNCGAVDLLDQPRLVAQLGTLERRTARSGRDTIDHAPNALAAAANAVAGAVTLLRLGARPRVLQVFAPKPRITSATTGDASTPVAPPRLSPRIAAFLRGE